MAGLNHQVCGELDPRIGHARSSVRQAKKNFLNPEVIAKPTASIKGACRALVLGTLLGNAMWFNTAFRADAMSAPTLQSISTLQIIPRLKPPRAKAQNRMVANASEQTVINKERFSK